MNRQIMDRGSAIQYLCCIPPTGIVVVLRTKTQCEVQSNSPNPSAQLRARDETKKHRAQRLEAVSEIDSNMRSHLSVLSDRECERSRTTAARQGTTRYGVPLKRNAP